MPCVLMSWFEVPLVCRTFSVLVPILVRLSIVRSAAVLAVLGHFAFPNNKKTRTEYEERQTKKIFRGHVANSKG